MVICCVPACGVDSFSKDTSITFHDFPNNPDLGAKWIQQINAASTTKGQSMWFPRGRPMICSKHFLHTDFKVDSDSLRPNCIPTVFGYKYIGVNPTDRSKNVAKSSPLIVKVEKPTTDQFVISDVFSQSELLTPVTFVKSYSKTVPTTPPLSNSSIMVNQAQLKTSAKSSSAPFFKLFSKSSNSKNQCLSAKLNQSLRMLKNQGNIILNANTNNTINTSVGSDEDTDMTLDTPLRLVAGNKLPNVLNKLSHNLSSSPPNCSQLYKKSIPNSHSLPNFKRLYANKSKTPSKKKKTTKGSNHELIEIGPNTFLKINPEVIKINKKQTPSGNTVLQFVMDQKLARDQSADYLPKLVHLSPGKECVEKTVGSVASIDKVSTDKEFQGNQAMIQHVLGHLVDTPVSKDADDCVLLEDDNATDNNENTDQGTSNEATNPRNGETSSQINKKAVPNLINKAPVLFTTHNSLSHYSMDKSKLVLQNQTKSKTIQRLNNKIEKLTKKIEEIEDKCIVQERQLSYSFIKKLRSIKKNATKGDPAANYILEQIRLYTGSANKMKWSDSTLSQCAVWCKKAPYAYEYFKKADFFKLPCLGTVKRFMKKHPDLVLQSKSKQPPKKKDESSSSSDFDFDSTDSEKEGEDRQEKNSEETVACKTILKERSRQEVETNENEADTSTAADENTEKAGGSVEIQEIVLPSGEVVQCTFQNVSNGIEGENQYYIIPNVDGQSSGCEQQFNVVQATDETLPAILRNLETSHSQNEQQLIFITNSSEQMECMETEVTTAHT